MPHQIKLFIKSTFYPTTIVKRKNKRKEDLIGFILIIVLVLLYIFINYENREEKSFLVITSVLLYMTLFVLFVRLMPHRIQLFMESIFPSIAMLILFLCYIFIDEPNIDSLVSSVFFIAIIFDFAYKLLKLFQAKILRESEYSYKNIIYLSFTVLLFVILLQIKKRDTKLIQSSLDSIFLEVEANKCPKKQCYLYTYEVTKGVTSLLLLIQKESNCITISSYGAFPPIKPIKKCD